MIELILFTLTIFTIAFIHESRKHPETESFTDIVSYLFKELLPKPVPVTFDTKLICELKEIASTYTAVSFEPIVEQLIFNNVKRISIRFVPKRKLTDDEINELCIFFRRKFALYLECHHLNFKYFISFINSSEEMTFNILYLEFAEEETNFMKEYRKYIRELSPMETGLLIDDKLETELAAIEKEFN